MNHSPRISVIIPAYNQARYLADAVESVLAQTFVDYEIIVVDDGSTDETPAVAAQFGEKIRYIRQENRGLAGARNTGIRAARGEYIGLLDSDDAWMPAYIERVMAAAERSPRSAVIYCAAACMDQDGRDLRQTVGYKEVAEDNLYHALLRSNFIIPSTVCLRRDAVERVGYFDESLRSCEDWDMWLRLLPDHQFTGLADVLVRYRIHGSSLSANVAQMQASKRKVVEKHFGADDQQYADWPDEKRRAYSGYYRYEVLTSVQMGRDWSKAASLRKACLIDPSSAGDVSLFYELALGDQPKGYRGKSAQHLSLEANASRLIAMLDEVFPPSQEDRLAKLRKQAYASAYKALGLAAYNTGQYALCRRYLLSAVRHQPRLCYDRLVAGNFFKSFLGKKGLAFLRGRKTAMEAGRR